jgi:hypothetical protein
VDKNPNPLKRTLSGRLKLQGEHRITARLLKAYRWQFELLRALIITLDLVVLAWNIESASGRAYMDPFSSITTHGGLRDEWAFMIFNDVFASLFALELLLFLHIERGDFLRHNVSWHVFNLITGSAYVMLAVVQHVLVDQRAFSDVRIMVAHFANLRIFRMLQLVDLTGTLRKNPAFQELRIMVSSLTSALNALLWSAIMVFVILILCAVWFAEGTLIHCVSFQLLTDFETKDLRKHFGSVSRAILTLFMSMSGGDDWAKFLINLRCLPWAYQAGFLFFITFAVIALMNVVTPFLSKAPCSVRAMTVR